ncbi:hypothetical protein SGCOL_009759 [Colletotrichum sp. CLE4]
MNRRKKIVLSVALGFGSAIVVIYKCLKLPSLTSSDYTYDTVELVIWTVVEGSIIIIAACIPVLQPLGELLFGKRIFSSRNGKYLSGNSKSRLSGRLGTTKGLFRTPVKKTSQEGFDADSFNSIAKTTVVGRGSQESILEQHGSDGKIVRTDAFTVTIEMNKMDKS